jgi:hypothetical protein
MGSWVARFFERSSVALKMGVLFRSPLVTPALGQCGRDAEHARVLEATYLAAPAKQRAVADALAMSWSTYRRRLGEATDRTVEAMWQRESSSVGARA